MKHEDRRLGQQTHERLAAEISFWLHKRGKTMMSVQKDLEGHWDAPYPPKGDETWRTWLKEGRIPAGMWPLLASSLTMHDESSPQTLVSAFGYDPTYLLRKLEILPSGVTDLDEVIEQVFRLHRLELQFHTLQMEAATLSQRSAVQAIIQTALGQQYAAAVWPTFAGPGMDSRYLMHTADRIDLRRIDGEATDCDEVWSNPVLRSTLGSAFAVRGNAFPRWSERDTPGVARWAVKYVGAPSAPRISKPHSGFPAITISSITTGAGGGEMASIIAMVLGYGVTSTSDLALELHDRRSPVSTSEHRNAVNEQLLRAPRERRVWHHSALLNPDNPSSPWTDAQGAVAAELVHVRLVESDELIFHAANNRLDQRLGPSDALVTTWKRNRDLAIERGSSMQYQRLLRLDVQHFGNTGDRWTQIMSHALSVLNFLRELGLRPHPSLAQVQESLMQSDPGVAPALYRWMQEQGAPFVSFV